MPRNPKPFFKQIPEISFLFRGRGRGSNLRLGEVILSLSLPCHHQESRNISQCKGTKTQARFSGGIAQTLNLRLSSSPLNRTRTYLYHYLLGRKAFKKTRTCSFAYALKTAYNGNQQSHDCVTGISQNSRLLEPPESSENISTASTTG